MGIIRKTVFALLAALILTTSCSCTPQQMQEANGIRQPSDVYDARWSGLGLP